MGLRGGRRSGLENEGEIGMKRIEEALRRADGVTEYKIVSTKVQSYELFWVHERLETVRRTDTTQMSVTVYARHDDCLGSSRFAVNAGMDDEALQNKIKLAVRQARLSKDKAYELPAAGVEEKIVPGNVGDMDPVALGAEVADTILGAAQDTGAQINALEIFVNRTVIRVKNSRGLDKTQTVNTVSYEAIPTCDSAGLSTELYEYVQVADWDKKTAAQKMRSRLQDVVARSKAQHVAVPPCAVVLNGAQLQELVGELIGTELDYAAVSLGRNVHEPGYDYQQGGNGDRLTVTVRGVIDGSAQSRYFDDDGTALVDRCVLQQGKLAALWGSNRYAQYCGGEPTGAVHCFDVQKGTADLNDLDGKVWLHCVDWSGLQVDLYNDYIGGEVRLAYLHEGDKCTPVTGIYVSGKLSELLPDMRLSAELDLVGGWRLPKYTILQGMSVL